MPPPLPSRLKRQGARSGKANNETSKVIALTQEKIALIVSSRKQERKNILFLKRTHPFSKQVLNEADLRSKWMSCFSFFSFAPLLRSTYLIRISILYLLPWATNFLISWIHNDQVVLYQHLSHIGMIITHAAERGFFRTFVFVNKLKHLSFIVSYFFLLLYKNKTNILKDIAQKYKQKL